MFRSRKNAGQAEHVAERGDTNEFYDAVADVYHLFYRDWQATVDREGITLRRTFAPRKVKTVLDASCGTGTQSIALARQGFTVTAADISGTMLAKAKEYATNYKVADKIDFVQVGFLELPTQVHGPFDAVITKGNALPHLLADEDIISALHNFHALLRPGGTLIIGIRDFDLLLEDRPRMIPGHFHDDPNEQNILFDIWDWDDGPPVTVTFNKFIVSGQGSDYHVAKNTVKYRALRRVELETMLITAGFTDLKADQQHWELVFTATRP